MPTQQVMIPPSSQSAPPQQQQQLDSSTVNQSSTLPQVQPGAQQLQVILAYPAHIK